MKAVLPKPQRCAIYTRKSTEHNLDLAFNSLDAQREACEAYIKSQAHEGWKLNGGRFDDGGLSGASLDRPALQALLEQVRTRRVDVIVVYKVDRLTRSLADFAKLVELFDAFDVSFVSVTQSFNTTSSMGRLTLNVLLSFAQFEREVIGERVRDKIAASKRKGLWVGGPVPLGYKSVNKKIEIVPEDAMLVQKIFRDLLRLGSIAELAGALDQEGVKPNPRRLASGKVVAAERFMIGPLAHMLKNRFYIGEIAYRSEIHKGEHEPILDREVFEAVQAQLAQRTVKRKLARFESSAAILAGLIFDDRGRPMSPSHANKKGVRYRYYVSQGVARRRREALLAAICDTLKREVKPNTEVLDADLVRATLERAVVRPMEIAITLRASDAEEVQRREVTIPFAPRLAPRKGVAYAPAQQPGTIDAVKRDALLKAIGRSRGWLDAILTGANMSFEEIASAEGLAERHVRFLAPLAFVSPRVVGAVANSAVGDDLTVSDLARTLPRRWDDQERLLGVA